ncbi:MAG: hypothetical protein A2Z97_14650 [Bdellovibrionales bacterium GWB1_52_6]|nr:MAG: hypothetical protein A2Z97_14650 [Bdellovibrionales bacterium GWB1_52_6]OFZ02586.1 MAG: hypothetical protein A2X97_07985 [Bdellovibrionales bacterium GWA1_52_35]HCM41438.1 hypothetical protein [Bdellovibrionales bacterium]
MKKSTLAFLTLTFVSIELSILQAAASASNVSIQDRIKTQVFFKNAYPAVFGKAEYGSVQKFSAALKSAPAGVRKQADLLIDELDAVLPYKILMPLVYWKVLDPKPDQLAKVLAYHAANRLLILRDFLDNPLQGADGQKAEVLEYFRDLLNAPSATSLEYFEKAHPGLTSLSRKTAAIEDPREFARRIISTRLYAENFLLRFPYLRDFSTGWFGYIPGNKVELISDNDRSMERIQWLNDRAIFAGGKLDWNAPYMLMDGPDAHIIFKNDPIFKKIRELVDSAHDSIFIDIFLCGGTMGGALARYLIDQALLKAAANPDFRVLILHDFATNYNMKDEMMPVFEYIRDRIRNEPAVGRVVSLLQANIQRHPPGIPFGITNLIPKTDAVFKEVEKRNTYFESKIDHSKVIVVDANSDRPQAYFGSKNWTDHSGGYYYDNALYVAGPAAALVQAAYWDDVDAALTRDEQERKWFFFKEQGFGNDGYLSRRKELLDWFQIARLEYPIAGNQPVRLGEANVDGVIKDVRNMLIEMIQGAERHIYMEQLFIYDKYINDALIKRKIQKPQIDIRVLADHNGNFGFGGFPNTMFVRELVANGIQVRARRTLGVTATFPNGESRTYHQENHRKISSFDGKTMMVGSSNLNPDTLQGSFRELGAQIFDQEEIAKFENYFVADWSSEEQTQDSEIDSFRFTIGKTKLSPEISALINDVGAVIVRSKDLLEGRY